MTDEREKALETAIARIERQFGKGAIMKLGQTAFNVEAISTGSIGLDVAMSNCGVDNIKLLVVNNGVDIDSIIEVIKVYKIKKIMVKKETESLIVSKITNSINNFKIKSYGNNKIIVKNNILGTNKIILQVFNKNKIKIEGNLKVS